MMAHFKFLYLYYSNRPNWNNILMHNGEVYKWKKDEVRWVRCKNIPMIFTIK